MFTILSLVLLALVTRLLYSAFIKDAPLIPSTFSFPAEGRKRALNTDYSRVLPPSQRYLLARVLATAVPAADNAVPGDRLCLEEDWRTADASRHIFSGFSVREVRALGDFPDYATLSGVPLPSPLMDFDISSEVPRPYRPIRWPYHQTMCASHSRFPAKQISTSLEAFRNAMKVADDKIILLTTAPRQLLRNSTVTSGSSWRAPTPNGSVNASNSTETTAKKSSRTSPGQSSRARS